MVLVGYSVFDFSLGFLFFGCWLTLVLVSFFFFSWLSVLAEQGPLFEENMFGMLLSFSWLVVC